MPQSFFARALCASKRFAVKKQPEEARHVYERQSIRANRSARSLRRRVHLVGGGDLLDSGIDRAKDRPRKTFSGAYAHGWIRVLWNPAYLFGSESRQTVGPRRGKAFLRT